MTRLRPDSASVAFGRGMALLQRGDAGAAFAVLGAAVQARPGHVPALLGLSEAASRLGRDEEAVHCAAAAVSAQPAHGGAAARYAAALAALAAGGGDVSRWLQAMESAPALSAAGAALGRVDAYDAALEALEAALARGSADIDTRVNLGCALFKLGRYAEAEAALQGVLAQAPEHAVARFGLANALLARGVWQAGWEAYESRWRLPGAAPLRGPGPAWQGEDMAGRRLLVLPEQGFGDMLQFARFLPLVPGGARFQAPKALRRLVPEAEPADDASGTECHCALMSLPRLLRVGLAEARVPYLRADPDMRTRWRARLPALGNRARRRVGLVWSGGGRRPEGGAMQAGAGRSLDAAALAPLLAVPGVRFVSLQHGAPGAAAALGLPDPMPGVTDFADTAALLAELDLLVSVDTAAAHLAGALGCPAWIMLRPDTDWRWPREGQHSAWYPTLRLFRQRAPGDWAGVVAEVAACLADWA